MSTRRAEIANKAGDVVGLLAANGFSTWKKSMGDNVAFLWVGERGDYTDGVVVDTRAAMRQLPPGEHKGLLLRRARIPESARNELTDCEFEIWKAV